jgi:hypothetical protein
MGRMLVKGKVKGVLAYYQGAEADLQLGTLTVLNENLEGMGTFGVLGHFKELRDVSWLLLSNLSEHRLFDPDANFFQVGQKCRLMIILQSREQLLAKVVSVLVHQQR